MDRREACLAALAAAAVARRGSAASAHQPEQPERTGTRGVEAFEIETLSRDREASGRAYLPFLERATLSAGLYALAAGATDRQQPHDRDELYYVVKGRARFVVEGEEPREVAVREGTVLFVAAHVPHRFLEIEEDLSILVFFAAPAGEKPE